MKKLLILVSAFVLLSASVSTLHAQELESGYFLGGNPYAFRLNPAFQSERGIFSLALGGTNVGVWSNLGVNTLFYPDQATGKLYTFMNDRVPAADFLRKIKRSNSLDLDLNVNLLTLGFWSKDSFFTLDFNVRSVNAVSVPYDYFNFLKQGTETTSSFDLSGMGIRSKSFIEAAFGWSRNYNDVFNVGFRVKGLVGIEEVEAMVSKANLTLNDDRCEISATGYLNASSPSLSIQRDENGYLDFETLEFKDNTYGPAGYGAAVDLGFSWNVLPLLTLSGAFLDLGAIRWNREIKGISPETKYSWVPSESGQTDQDTFEKEMEKMMEAMSNIYKFKDVSNTGGGVFEALPFRVNLGAEFRMPFYDRLSVGALYMGRGGACFAKHAGRFSLNWNPLDFLSFSTGTTLNRFGESIGFALNLHPAGVNLLIGCDYIPFSVMNASTLINDIPDQYRKYAVIPTGQMKMNLYIGLNLAIGRRHLDYARRFRS